MSCFPEPLWVMVITSVIRFVHKYLPLFALGLLVVLYLLLGK